jgi:hypothetical protein
MRISLHTIPQLSNTANNDISLALKLIKKYFFDFFDIKSIYYNDLILIFN